MGGGGLDADSSVSPRSVPSAKPLLQSQPTALPAQGFKSNGVSAFEDLLLVLSSQLPSVLTSGSLSAALARVIPQAGAQDLEDVLQAQGAHCLTTADLVARAAEMGPACPLLLPALRLP